MRLVSRVSLLVAFLCSFAFAQNSGNIYGKVTDSTGAPLPNVKVTLTSPALINPGVETSSTAGLFQFPTLPIGTYKLTFEAPGFSTSVRDGVELTAGFTADVNIAMVKGAAGSTVVSSQSQMVDRRETTVQSNVGASQLANVGASRDVWSITALTPGSQIVGTVDVGGSQAGSQRNTYNYGYPGSQARNSVDGVNMTEGTSSSMLYLDYGAIQELRQTTAANDAAQPVPGQFLNAIVKQGGDTTHMGLYFDYENPSFQGHNVSDSQVEQGAGQGTRVTRYQDLNGDIGGKIIKSRLWYYTSIRYQRLGTGILGWPVENPSMTNPPFYKTDMENFTEKITYKVKKNHRLMHFMQYNQKYMPYRNAGPTYWLDATYKQNSPSWAGNMRYEGTITPKFYLNATLGTAAYNWTNAGWPTTGCPAQVTAVPCATGQYAPRLYETSTGDLEGSYPNYLLNRRRWSADTAGKYFADHILGTNMNFTFGYVWERESARNATEGPLGETYYMFNSPAGGNPATNDFTVPYQIQIENGPTRTMDIERHQGAYISDQIKLGRRAVLSAGVRWDAYRNYYPNEQVYSNALYRNFYYAGQPLPNGYTIPASNPSFQWPGKTMLDFPAHFAPRIGIAIDLTGKATTILKLSYGRFWINPGGSFTTTYNPVTYVGGGTSGSPTSGTGMTFKWTDPTQAPFNWNQVGAFVSGGLPNTATLAPNIRLPHQDEGTMFLERQFTKTFSLRAGLVFRRQIDDIYQKDLGRPYSLYTQPFTIYDNGPDGLKGTADDKGNLTVCCDVPTGTKLPLSSMQATNNTTPEEYYGTDITANKRMSNHWMVTASFSWSAAHTLYAGSTSNAQPSNPLQAYNNYYRISYWGSNLRGSYQAKYGIMISPAVRLMQGQPTDRLVNATGLNVGTYALVVDPWGSHRYDNVLVADVRLQKNFKLREKYTVGLFFDLYNITNNNARVTYNTTTGRKSITLTAAQYPSLAGTYSYAQFGAPSTIVGPRVARLGVKFNF